MLLRTGPAGPGICVAAIVMPLASGGWPGPAVSIESIPGAVRALIMFFAVVAIGAILLSRRADLVDRSVERSTRRPLSCFAYGLIAFVLIVFLGGILIIQSSQIGVATGMLAFVGICILAGGLLVVGSFGYLVSGSVLTGLTGDGRQTTGLVIAAGLGAVGWLFLPPLVAAGVWLLGAATGIGGPMRSWLHAEKGIPSDELS